MNHSLSFSPSLSPCVQNSVLQNFDLESFMGIISCTTTQSESVFNQNLMFSGNNPILSCWSVSSIDGICLVSCSNVDHFIYLHTPKHFFFSQYCLASKTILSCVEVCQLCILKIICTVQKQQQTRLNDCTGSE